MSTFDLLKPSPGLKVLVTGGAAGIGAAIAKAFNEVGANVYVCDIDPVAVDAIRSENSGIHAAVADVAKEEDATRVVNTAADALGGLDVLVNNAGIAGPTGLIEEMEPTDWERTISTNLNSQFYFLRRAVPKLKASQTPSIIAMSSVAGRLGYPFRTAYASTKWAIIGLMKSLAIELGRVDGFEDDEAKSECDEGCKVLVRFLATERNALEALELADEVFDTGAGSIECLREERWPVLGR